MKKNQILFIIKARCNKVVTSPNLLEKGVKPI